VIRIAVVDDHEFIVGVLRRTFAAQADLELVAVCDRGAEALERLPEIDAEVVLLDRVLQDRDGLDVLEQLVAAGVQARILLFSAGLDREAAEAAVGLGAAGGLSKLSGAAAVCDAIRRAAAGEHVYPDD
jgi:DNA-binding NarL/FixJ family response regulator